MFDLESLYFLYVFRQARTKERTSRRGVKTNEEAGGARGGRMLFINASSLHGMILFKKTSFARASNE